MFDNTKTNRRLFSLFLALAAAFAISAGTKPAFASGSYVPATGGPSQVEFPSFFMIQYQSINYIGTQVAHTCTGPLQSNIGAFDIDTIRFWNSLAQAALLSGKTLGIYFNDCTEGSVTNHYINDVVLIK